MDGSSRGAAAGPSGAKSARGRRRWAWIGGAAAALAAVVFGTCTCTTFGRRWSAAIVLERDRRAAKESAAEEAPKPAPERELVDGRWVGTWKSDVRGLSGALSCVVRKLEDGGYEASFRAKAFGLVNVDQNGVVLRADKTAVPWKLAGEKDLGWLMGGLYKYAGESDGADFVCRFSAANGDRGVFTMRRPDAGSEPPADSSGAKNPAPPPPPAGRPAAGE